MSMPKIMLENVRKDFCFENEELNVLKNISLRIESGEFVSIIGPSGCGKSTIFHILTGLEPQYEGVIEIEGIRLEKTNKKMSYMHQKDLLMPWRTVMDNVILPLEIQGLSKKEAKAHVQPLFGIFGLEGFEKAFPSELSGGMRQKVSLFRTILADSDILLLDEPFGALDAISRSNMQNWLLEIWDRFKRTVLFVTHDIEEAVYLSDRIYVLSQRPAEVIDEISIDFPRPRIKDIVVSSKFTEYKKLLLSKLK